MDEYYTPSYETITTQEKMHLREFFNSSLLNALTPSDFYTILVVLRRAIERLEEDDEASDKEDE